MAEEIRQSARLRTKEVSLLTPEAKFANQWLFAHQPAETAPAEQRSEWDEHAKLIQTNCKLLHTFHMRTQAMSLAVLQLLPQFLH